ncbi:hypothetical protein MY7_0749 [Bacillus sp. 5B6]|nr:hypothetical protein MY7_0749 [Bacillus sp. 5B6]
MSKSAVSVFSHLKLIIPVSQVGFQIQTLFSIIKIIIL